jgi:hypothetical protein
MATNYTPKTKALAPNRIQKICKTLIDEAGSDRGLALEAHKFFKAMVEENPQDNTAKQLMVDCLKAAQTSKNNVIKILDLVIKLEDKVPASDKTKNSANTNNSVFSQLDSLIDEQKK